MHRRFWVKNLVAVQQFATPVRLSILVRIACHHGKGYLSMDVAKESKVADTKGSTATLVHQSLKQRQWKSHQPVHWGLKYEHSAGSLEIETETVGVPPASPLGIEIFTARQLVGD